MPNDLTKFRVAVVTGSRADFGLLSPVMAAIQAHPRHELQVIAAGTHLLPPALTIRDVEASFDIAATVPMQEPDQANRLADAGALGRGIGGMAAAFARLTPHWVVVLGDRIEAFAGAAAGSVAGIAVAHLHGGDRAEGIADEALRHAITKLAHLHLAATAQSAQRVIALGERPEHVHNVGSPAVDGLGFILPMSDLEAAQLGNPAAVVLMHPSALPPDRERTLVGATLEAVHRANPDGRVLCLAPNHDPGREVVLAALQEACRRHDWRFVEHLERRRFVSLLRRLAGSVRGVIVGNSSAGLIEAAAVRLPALDVGPRQAGRERPNNVVSVGEEERDAIGRQYEAALGLRRKEFTHPYGDGRTAERVANLLAAVDPRDPGLLAKRNTY